MAIDYGDRGYAYTLDVCTAIEQYTAREVKRNRSAFRYRRLDLRYAVERRLYIHCVNSEALFSFYIGGNRDLRGLTPVEIQVARGFPDVAIRAPSYLRLFGASGLSFFRRLWQWVLAPRSVMDGSPIAKPALHAPILIHVVHSKFVSYLKPVVRNLSKADYAYLVSIDVGLAAAIERLDEPYLHEPRCSGRLRSVFLGITLRNFPDLVEAAETILAAVKRVRPRCVLMAEGNAPLDSITTEVCRLLGIQSLCVQQGWSPVVHNGFRNLSFDEMFVWGEGFISLLQPFNPRQRFTATGSYVLHGSEPVKETVRSGPAVISFFLQAPCALLSSSGYDEFIELIIWCAVTYPSVRLLVREHPSYPVPLPMRVRLGFENVRFSIPSNESLVDVVCASSLAVSVFSTVLLEAIALGTVPLICGIGSLPRYEPDLAGLGAAIEVRSLADARQVIARVVCDPSYLDPYRAVLASVASRYFKQGDSARAISDRIKVAAGVSDSTTP